MKNFSNLLLGLLICALPKTISAQCGVVPISTHGNIQCNKTDTLALWLKDAPCIDAAMFTWTECSSADGPDSDTLTNDALCTKTMMLPSMTVKGTGANKVTIYWMMMSPTWIKWQKAPNNYAKAISIYINGTFSKKVDLPQTWQTPTSYTFTNMGTTVITFSVDPADIVANGGNMSVVEWAEFGITGSCGSSVDTTGPIITKIPKDTTIVCGNAFPNWKVTATDACDPAPKVSIDSTLVSALCPITFSWVYTVTVTDSSGNVTKGKWAVNVLDTIKPVVIGNLPKDVTISCTDSIPDQLDLQVSDCSPTTQIKSAATSGTPCETIILYTWIISDNCNETTYTRKVTIKDTTAPVWISPLPKDTTVLIPPPFDSLFAKDDCSAITYSMQETKQGDSCSYLLVRTWTATDACGNILTHTQKINVLGGGTPWWITPLPTDTAVQCNAIPVFVDLIAQDSLGNIPVFKNEVYSGDSCNFTITRTWTATSSCGTTRTHTQIITVTDTTDPLWTTPLPGDTTILCGTSLSDTATVGAMDMCWRQVGVTLVFTQVSTDSLITRTWTATDKCGNSVSYTQRITILKAQFNLNPVVTNVSCFGYADGSIDLQPTGSYAYLWNTGDTTSSIDSLAPGSYTVTVSQGACDATYSFVITQPDSMNVHINQVSALCFGGNGQIILTVSGGSTPYTYLWNTGATTNSFTDTAGIYSVTITDANGCSKVVSGLTITQPTQLQLNLSPTAVTCQVGNDGRIDLQATGGTAPYTYQWSNGTTNPSPANLVPGLYQVVVSDANGCVMTDTTEVRCLGCKVYPNPAVQGGNCTININTGDPNDDGEVEFTVYDILGKRKQNWRRQMIDGYLVETFVADLDPGKYLLEAKGPGIHFVKEFSIN